MRYGQIVMGPAGSGKVRPKKSAATLHRLDFMNYLSPPPQSTYCNTMVNHCHASKRSVYVVNLDPAAEHFEYPVHIGKDIAAHM